MGRRGPPPKPTRLKLLEGNPGKRRLPANEPKPRPVAPSCPRSLKLEAKREWRRIVPELDRLGLLAVIDRGQLAGYCQSWAIWVEAEEWLAANGRTYILRDEDGNVRYAAPWPEVKIARDALADMRAFGARFGLSPSDRTRMTVPAAPEEDDLDALLG